MQGQFWKLAFKWEKVKTMNVLETIAALDLKLGRCRQLMKFIKVGDYSRLRSFHDDLKLQDQASGERSQDKWSSGISRHCFQVQTFIYFSQM